MDNRRSLSQASVESKFSTSAIQLEHINTVRQVRNEPGDSVNTIRVRTNKHSNISCKVPRFQYADFPSLHQCIKQLSVPPLEGWRESCPLRKMPAHSPNSPKQKVPKFNYMNYPSLYHCIQQLSVPPLEIWSSKLTKPSPSRLPGKIVGMKCPSHVLRGRNKNEDMQKIKTEQKIRDRGHRGTYIAPIPEPSVLEHLKERQPSCISEKEDNYQGDSNTYQKNTAFSSDYSFCRSESCSRPELDVAGKSNEKRLRPSVISLVRTKRQKHISEPEEQAGRWKSPDHITQVAQPIDLVLDCPLGQQIFIDPVEHQMCQIREHNEGHNSDSSKTSPYDCLA